MPDADDILDDAMQPLSVKGDMGEVVENSPTEKIEADRYSKAQTGAASKTLGFRFRRIVPPNANGS